MKNKLQTIKNNLLDKTWKKCLITFIIIFLLIITVGVVSVDYLSHVITDSNVDVVTSKVVDKVNGDNLYNNYFLIITEDNQTFAIEDNNDGHGKKMFDSIEINKTYEFTIRHPDITDNNQFTHILRVKNDTGRSR